jgi:hypothetical protein
MFNISKQDILNKENFNNYSQEHGEEFSKNLPELSKFLTDYKETEEFNKYSELVDKQIKSPMSKNKTRKIIGSIGSGAKTLVQGIASRTRKVGKGIGSGTTTAVKGIMSRVKKRRNRRGMLDPGTPEERKKDAKEAVDKYKEKRQEELKKIIRDPNSSDEEKAEAIEELNRLKKNISNKEEKKEEKGSSTQVAETQDDEIPGTSTQVAEIQTTSPPIPTQTSKFPTKPLSRWITAPVDTLKKKFVDKYANIVGTKTMHPDERIKWREAKKNASKKNNKSRLSWLNSLNRTRKTRTAAAKPPSDASNPEGKQPQSRLSMYPPKIQKMIKAQAKQAAADLKAKLATEKAAKAAEEEKELNAELEKMVQEDDAATKLQARWRGNKSRNIQSTGGRGRKSVSRKRVRQHFDKKRYTRIK